MDSIKKMEILFILSLAFVLLVGGCAREVPVSPSNETPLNHSESNDSNNISVAAFDFIKVKSIDSVDNIKNMSCHYSDKLKADLPIIINDSKIVMKYELINMSNDSIKVKINDDKDVLTPLNRIAEISFANGVKILFNIFLIREDYAMVCVNNNEEYDIAFCESTSGSNRFRCFDNLGYLNGIDYCQKILNSNDKKACEGGAKGTNG